MRLVAYVDFEQSDRTNLWLNGRTRTATRTDAMGHRRQDTSPASLVLYIITVMYALPLTPVPVSAGSKAPTVEFESSETGFTNSFLTTSTGVYQR